MAQAVLGAWTVRPGDAGTRLGSSGCGHCPECRHRLSAWCRERGEIGDLATLHGSIGDAEQDLAAVACLSAVERAGLGPDDVLVVLLSDGLPAWLGPAARRLTGGVVHVADDLKDPQLREALTSRPTGRADGIAVRRDAAAAVRAVRRGGVVCVGSTEPHLPSVTDLVQREVRLVGAGGLSDRLLAALPVAAGSGATA